MKKIKFYIHTPKKTLRKRKDLDQSMKPISTENQCLSIIIKKFKKKII